MKTLVQISSLLFVFLISSCDFKEDYELPSWDIEASAPIASSSVSFDDLLVDTTLSIDTLGDKSLVFVYQKDLVEYNFDEIVELNSISINRSVLVFLGFSTNFICSKRICPNCLGEAKLKGVPAIF